MAWSNTYDRCNKNHNYTNQSHNVISHMRFTSYRWESTPCPFLSWTSPARYYSSRTEKNNSSRSRALSTKQLHINLLSQEFPSSIPSLQSQTDVKNRQKLQSSDIKSLKTWLSYLETSYMADLQISRKYTACGISRRCFENMITFMFHNIIFLNCDNLFYGTRHVSKTI